MKRAHDEGIGSIFRDAKRLCFSSPLASESIVDSWDGDEDEESYDEDDEDEDEKEDEKEKDEKNGDGTKDEGTEELMRRLAAEEEDGLFRKLRGKYSATARRYQMSTAKGRVSCIDAMMCGCSGHVVRRGTEQGSVLATGFVRLVADEHGCYVQIDVRQIPQDVLIRRTARTKLSDEYSWIPCEIGTGARAFYAGDAIPTRTVVRRDVATPDPIRREKSDEVPIPNIPFETRKTVLDSFVAESNLDSVTHAESVGDGFRNPSRLITHYFSKKMKMKNTEEENGCHATAAAAAENGVVSDSPRLPLPPLKRKPQNEVVPKVKVKCKHSEFSRNSFYVRVSDVFVQRVRPNCDTPEVTERPK